MFFDFTSEQKLIQESARKIFNKYYSIEEVRKFTNNPSINKTFIKSIAENGILGILANHELGSNLGLTDALPIFIESGHRLVPFPLMENIIGAKVLSEINHELASLIIQGETLITISWSDMGKIESDGDTWKVSGILEKVPFAKQCEWLLVPVLKDSDDENLSLVVINTKNDKVIIKKENGIDLTYPLYRVEVSEYVIESGNIIGNIDEGQKIYDDMKNMGAILVSAEMYGISKESLLITVEYTKERVQFGQKIAQFQSLKHIAADRYVDIVSELAAVQYAAWEYDEKLEGYPISIAVVKAFNSEASLKTVEDSIQLQGGIGYTWENDLHLYLKRALRSAYTLGDSNYYRNVIATKILN